MESIVLSLAQLLESRIVLSWLIVKSHMRWHAEPTSQRKGGGEVYTSPAVIENPQFYLG